MNRERYGNYVKGAIMAYSGIASPPALISADYIHSSIRDGDKFDYENWVEDGYYTILGFNDMLSGRIK